MFPFTSSFAVGAQDTPMPTFPPVTANAPASVLSWDTMSFQAAEESVVPALGNAPHAAAAKETPHQTRTADETIHSQTCAPFEKFFTNSFIGRRLVTAAAVEFVGVRIRGRGTAGRSPPVCGVHALQFTVSAGTYHSAAVYVVRSSRSRAPGVASRRASALESGDPSVRGFRDARRTRSHLKGSEPPDFGIERSSGREQSSSYGHSERRARSRADTDFSAGILKGPSSLVEFEHRIDDTVPRSGREGIRSRSPIGGRESGSKGRVCRRKSDEGYEKDGCSDRRAFRDCGKFGVHIRERVTFRLRLPARLKRLAASYGKGKRSSLAMHSSEVAVAVSAVPGRIVSGETIRQVLPVPIRSSVVLGIRKASYYPRGRSDIASIGNSVHLGFVGIANVPAGSANRNSRFVRVQTGVYARVSPCGNRFDPVRAIYRKPVGIYGSPHGNVVSRYAYGPGDGVHLRHDVVPSRRRKGRSGIGQRPPCRRGEGNPSPDENERRTHSQSYLNALEGIGSEFFHIELDWRMRIEESGIRKISNVKTT